MNVHNIIYFAEHIDLALVEEVIKKQIDYNMAIAQEGLVRSYGANIGAGILKNEMVDVRTKARAYAAAGSDARMNGCELPVIINSGSGNQGLTVTNPIVVYSKYLECGEEKLYRALLIGNLVALHQKSKIGRLSAFCGAVGAACGTAAGITYLYGEKEEIINKAISNTLGSISGMVCDGAKASCAAKISLAVEAAIMAVDMARENRFFVGGDGIIKNNIEDTINNIGTLASVGMKETDKEIVKMMIGM